MAARHAGRPVHADGGPGECLHRHADDGAQRARREHGIDPVRLRLLQFAADVPAAAKSDVQQLRRDVATQLTDVEGIVSVATAADWLADVIHWKSDASSLGGAVQLVRADLGLPPATYITPGT